MMQRLSAVIRTAMREREKLIRIDPALRFAEETVSVLGYDPIEIFLEWGSSEKSKPAKSACGHPFRSALDAK